MSVSGVLRLGREAFIGRMRATCKVTRLTGTSSTDDHGTVTQDRVTVYPDPDWSASHRFAAGPCYVRYPGLAFESNFDSAGVAVSQARVVVRIPHGPVFQVGDRVEILSDPDSPRLAGTTLRVATDDTQSQATAQRLLCEDNQSGVSGG